MKCQFDTSKISPKEGWRKIPPCPHAVWEKDPKGMCIFHSELIQEKEQAVQDAFHDLLSRPPEDGETYLLAGAKFGSLPYDGEIKYDIHFVYCTFESGVMFNDAIFHKEAIFYNATFHVQTNFQNTTFHKWAVFDYVTFHEKANFYNATFHEWAIFRNATFLQDISFEYAKLTDKSAWLAFLRAKIYQLEIRYLQGEGLFKLKDSAIYHIDYQDSEVKLELVRCRSYFRVEAEESPKPITTEIESTIQERNSKEIHERLENRLDHINNTLAKQADTQEVLEGNGNMLGRELRWNFSGQRLGKRLSFIECDMRRADFTSSDISEVYFDACKWNELAMSRTGWKRWLPFRASYAALYAHQTRIAQYRKKPSSDNNRLELDKLLNMYQRFKKYFEDSKDYVTAGNFHYREMEIRRILGREGWVSGLYGRFAHYGENWGLTLVSMFGVMFGLPLVTNCVYALYRWLVGQPCHFGDRYADFLQYFVTGVLPFNLGSTFGISKTENSSALDHLMDSLQLEHALPRILLIVMAVVYISSVLTLFYLFLMAIKRRFKR